MHLLLLGASHHTAPLDLRERIDFSKRGIPQALAHLTAQPSLAEVVVLSTCNRAEIYAACEDHAHARRELAGFMGRYHGVPESELAPHLYTRIDAEVAHHLFRVAAGLDSLVVGEPQILGQVKEAYAVAAAHHATGAILSKLFHWSFSVGKRVRADTGLGEGAVSVSYAAISLARKIFGSLKDLTALLVGAGEMAELTATHLRSSQVGRIAVANRTVAHAEVLAKKVDGVAISWEAMSSELAGSDIVVTATGSSTPLISSAHIEGAMRLRRNRPLFIIDIGLPRDVDPAAAQIEQVFLYNIDDLQAIVSENLARRRTQIERGEAMVGQDVDNFVTWLRSRDAIPTVVALRQRFEAIRQAELKRLEPKLAALPPPARARVEEITRLLVEKLLLTPTEQLKAVSDQETVALYADALSRLFNLGDDRGEPDEGGESGVEKDRVARPVTS